MNNDILTQAKEILLESQNQELKEQVLEILQEDIYDKLLAMIAAGGLTLSQAAEAAQKNVYPTDRYQPKKTQIVSKPIVAKSQTKKVNKMQNEFNMDKLLDALIRVESKGKDNAVGDQGRAIGCLQIHKEMVDYVNQLLGEKKYTYEDRSNRQKSKEMAKVYFNARRKVNPAWGYETLARQWNGGPSGHKKTATLDYWAKVKKELGL